MIIQQSYRDFASLPNIDKKILRDLLVRDRFSTNSSGRLPECLNRKDSRMIKVTNWLSINPKTKLQKGLRRGIALLYSTNTVCWVDYDLTKDKPVMGRWKLNDISLDVILN